MEKTIESYKEQIKWLKFGLFVMMILLVIVGSLSFLLDREYKKQLEFYKDNNTIKVSSYYLGVDDGIRQMNEGLTEIINSGGIIYYLKSDNKTIGTLDTSSCKKGILTGVK